MSRLNGWQRIWLALSVLWTLVVGGFAYAPLTEEPYVFHSGDYTAKPFRYKSSAHVVARMRDKSAIREHCDTESPPAGFSEIQFDVTVPQLSSPVQLCFHVRSPRVGDRATADGKTQEWDGKGWIDVPANPAKPPTFGNLLEKVGKDVETEYKRAYVEEQEHIRRGNQRTTLLFWLIPPIALYVLGWTIGWIRQGSSSRGRRGKLSSAVCYHA